MVRWYPFLSGRPDHPSRAKRRRPNIFWGILFFVIAAGVGAYYFYLPDVSYLRTDNPKTTAYMQVYVRRTLGSGKKPIIMMRWTPLSEISPFLQHAVLIEEDARFYSHGGVDWRAMRKAIEYDMKKGKWSRGASTITQQVARNLFLSPTRTKYRKTLEILIAWKLENNLPKDRILEIYLNIAEWGVGVYGAQAASQIYFGKDAKDVTLDEALALATALPSPWRLNPLHETTPLIAKKKEVILDRMRKAGYLPSEVSDTEVEVPGALDLPPVHLSGQ